SPDGLTVVTSSNGPHLRLWDVHTGKLVRKFEGSPGALHDVAFSPDGKTVGSSRFLNLDNSIRLLEVATGRERCGWNHVGAGCLAFSPDGKRLITGSFDTTCLVWDVMGLVKTPAGSIELAEEKWRRAWDSLADEDAPKSFQGMRQIASAK